MSSFALTEDQIREDLEKISSQEYIEKANIDLSATKSEEQSLNAIDVLHKRKQFVFT